MSEQKREFKGVWIPKEIWLNPDLNALEKCVLAEIDSLDNDEKGCFASNEYFGQFFGISEGRAANIISDLKKRGHVFQTFFDGRNRGLRLSKSESSVHENVKPELTKTLKQTSRKREHNNTVINTDNNPIKEIEAAEKTAAVLPGNITVEAEEKKETPPPVAAAPAPTKKEMLEADTDRVLTHLNEKGKFPRGLTLTSADNRRPIKKRLAQFPVEDLLLVVEFKCREWVGTDMQRHLHPETLFNGHFEKYLNAALLPKTLAPISKPEPYKLEPAPKPPTHQPAITP